MAAAIAASMSISLVSSSSASSAGTSGAAAPLTQAEDADLLDTSEMDIDAAIAAAIALVEQKLAHH